MMLKGEVNDIIALLLPTVDRSIDESHTTTTAGAHPGDRTCARSASQPNAPTLIGSDGFVIITTGAFITGPIQSNVRDENCPFLYRLYLILFHITNPPGLLLNRRSFSVVKKNNTQKWKIMISSSDYKNPHRQKRKVTQVKITTTKKKECRGNWLRKAVFFFSFSLHCSRRGLRPQHDDSSTPARFNDELISSPQLLFFSSLIIPCRLFPAPYKKNTRNRGEQKIGRRNICTDTREICVWCFIFLSYIYI